MLFFTERVMAILRAIGLRKIYGSKEVVKGINLTLQEGEIVGLLGPNGAGKTTTFYMMVGNIKPDTGRIFIDKEEITQMPMYKRARLGLGFLPQEPSVFRKLTVRDNLKAVLEIRGFDKETIEYKVEQALEEFSLNDIADKPALKLSGGQRRRTEIARAIVLEPRFLLLDEPFAGIDPITILDLKEILMYLKNKGIGVLITDHNVRETLSITDRAYIIKDGEVLEEGTPQVIINNQQVREAYLGKEFTL